jgi:hypothetical protein
MIMCVTSRKLLQMTKNNKSWNAQHKTNPEMGKKTRSSIKPHSPVVPFTRELVVNVDSEMLIKSGWQCQNFRRWLRSVWFFDQQGRWLYSFENSPQKRQNYWKTKKKVLLPRTIRKKKREEMSNDGKRNGRKKMIWYIPWSQTNTNRDCIRSSCLSTQ